MTGIARADNSATLPPVVALNYPESFDVWVLWRALDRRFLPSQIIAEPVAMLEDMLTLDGLYEALKPKEDDNG